MLAVLFACWAAESCYSYAVPSLTNALAHSSHLTPADREHISRFLGDWQLIADVSFADLFLSIPTDDGNILIVRHCRPATVGTSYPEDIAGDAYTGQLATAVQNCFDDKKIRSVRVEDREHTIYPVVNDGRPIALLDVVVSANRPEFSSTFPIIGANTYIEISDMLLTMVVTGEFPHPDSSTAYRHGTPRLTDGFVHLDDSGIVLYASPNAISNFHRIGLTGSLIGRNMADMIFGVVGGRAVLDEALSNVAGGLAPWFSEVETPMAILSLRSIPLLERGERLGAMLLCRDITEIRRREQELVTKDATIREINHRVKNNLQTVSALLRMQARRASQSDTQAALSEAQRRVATIAFVHQVLSQRIDEQVSFDEIVVPLLDMASDIAIAGDKVNVIVEGNFGKIGAAQTTALAVVLNELISNAIEHGLPDGGTIYVRGVRTANYLHVQVSDDGVGVGEDGPKRGLGISIVETLVAGELHGSIRWENGENGGTCVWLDMDVA